MPRDGSGASHNAEELGHNIVHGAGDNDAPASSGVDRSHKAAPPPDHEEGSAIEGMNASGGGDKNQGSGKGPRGRDNTVDEEAEKHSK